MFKNSLINAFGIRVSLAKMTVWKNVKVLEWRIKFKSIQWSSGNKRTERTKENINFLQEELIENPRILARKNGDY